MRLIAMHCLKFRIARLVINCLKLCNCLYRNMHSAADVKFYFTCLCVCVCVRRNLFFLIEERNFSVRSHIQIINVIYCILRMEEIYFS
jgi:hypothetical protein